MPLGYHAIAGELRARIERGQYAPGAQLPAEDALAREFGVSRQTVNKALLQLRAEGLVRVERGVGTIVRELPVLESHRIARQQAQRREVGDARGAFQAELAELGYETRSEVEISRELRAAEHILRIFVSDELPEGQGPRRDPRRQDIGHQDVIRARRMYAGDVPVQLATGHYPADIAEAAGLGEQDTGPGGTYSRLAEAGQAPARFVERVSIRMPDEAEAAFLRLDAEQRVIEVERVARNARGRTVEVNVIVMPAHQWQLVYEWDA